MIHQIHMTHVQILDIYVMLSRIILDVRSLENGIPSIILIIDNQNIITKLPILLSRKCLPGSEQLCPEAYENG